MDKESKTLEPMEVSARLRELAGNGKEIDAVELLRKKYPKRKRTLRIAVELIPDAIRQVLLLSPDTPDDIEVSEVRRFDGRDLVLGVTSREFPDTAEDSPQWAPMFYSSPCDAAREYITVLRHGFDMAKGVKEEHATDTPDNPS